MWNGHIERTNIAEHCIELVSPDTATVHSAPYRTGSKARGSEKTEIEKLLAENIIDLVQTEWAAPIIFVPKNDEIH